MMNTAEYSNRPIFLLWSEIEKWTPTSSLLRFGTLSDGWKIFPVSAFATQIEKKEKVADDAEYKMAGVKWYGEGIFHRETVLGNEQSASYLHPLIPRSIIYNRLFAWKESFAVVPKEFSGFYVSNEFPQFEIDETIALPEYVYLLFITKKIINAVNASSIGSAAVSRNRFKESDFLNFKVPIPPLPVQRKIVEHWKKAAAQLLLADDAIKKIQNDFETHLLGCIGITVPPVIPRNGRFTIKLSQNDRWDTLFFREDFVLLEKQIKEMPHVPIGNALNFISRSWNIEDFKQNEFEYIEISSVNKYEGIIQSRLVEVNEAPSRATTLVKDGDLIISTTRPYLGSFAIVNKRYNNCVCSSGFSLADSVKTDKLTKEFVLFFLKSPAGLRQMERRMSGGLYPAIVQSELEKILLPMPPLELQNKIIAEHQKGQNELARLRTEKIRIKIETVQSIEQMILGTVPL